MKPDSRKTLSEARNLSRREMLGLVGHRHRPGQPLHLRLLVSCFVILFLEPPSRLFLGWRKEVSPDKRPAFLAAGLFVLFFIIWSVPQIGYYFGILVKPLPITMILMGLAVIWFFLVRAVWRANLFERILGLNRVE